MRERFEKLAAIAEKGKIKWQTIPLRTRRTMLWTVVLLAVMLATVRAFRARTGRPPWSAPSWMAFSADRGSDTATRTGGTGAPSATSKFEVWDADSGKLLHLPSAFGAGERNLAGLNQTADEHELRIGFLEQQIAERLSQQGG